MRCAPAGSPASVPKPAASTDLVVDTRARFGFTVALGTNDDAHIRHLTLALPPQHAARLLAAQDAGATEQQLRDIAAEGLGEIYFRDGGRRAHGLEVEFTELFPTWLVSGRVGVGAGWGEETRLLVDGLSTKSNLSARSFVCLSTHRDSICPVPPCGSCLVC